MSVNNARQSLWMLVASFLFTCMGVCVKFAAARYAAAEIVFYRSVVSLAIMYLLVRWRGIPLATPHWRRQLFRGASGFVSLLLYFYAIALLPLATAVTLNYTSPMFMLAFLVGFSRAPFQKAMLGALFAGFLGVCLLLRPTFDASQWFAGAIGLASGVLAGLAYFNVRELGALGEPEGRTVFYFSLLSTLGAVAWIGLVGRFEFQALDVSGGLLLFGTGAFATFAQLAMTRSYRRGHAVLSSSLAYSAVIFASLFGIAFWDEHLAPDAWLAIALIAGGGIATARLVRGRSPSADAAPGAD